MNYRKKKKGNAEQVKKSSESESETDGAPDSSDSDISTGLHNILVLVNDAPSPFNRRRRESAPCGHTLERRKSFEDMPHLQLKPVKSTPRTFAPLCVIGHPHEKRHLHGCMSHCSLPHLQGKRRASCPESPDAARRKSGKEKQEPRRHSYGGEHVCHYKHGGKLHRCTSLLKASLTRPPSGTKHRLDTSDDNEGREIKRAFSAPDVQLSDHKKRRRDEMPFRATHSMTYLNCSLEAIKENKLSFTQDNIIMASNLTPIAEEGFQVLYTAEVD